MQFKPSLFKGIPLSNSYESFIIQKMINKIMWFRRLLTFLNRNYIQLHTSAPAWARSEESYNPSRSPNWGRTEAQRILTHGASDVNWVSVSHENGPDVCLYGCVCAGVCVCEGACRPNDQRLQIPTHLARATTGIEQNIRHTKKMSRIQIGHSRLNDMLPAGDSRDFSLCSILCSLIYIGKYQTRADWTVETKNFV